MVFEVIAQELRDVDDEIHRTIEIDEEGLTSVANHVFTAGGKRVRPALLLLSYLAANGDKIARAVPAAAAVEVIHTAALIHDDISDQSQLRRGRPAAHVSFGIARSLIAADYLMTAAFKLIGDYGVELLRTLNNACMNMAVGEIQDLKNTCNTKLTEDEYFQIIERKTGVLFEAAVRIGVMLAGGDAKQIEAFGTYGRDVGTAFQVVDDVLDIAADTTALGKPSGGDIRDGKMTIATIHALKKLKGKEREFFRQVMSRRGDPPSEEDVAKALLLVRKSDAEAYGRSVARKRAEQAKRALKDMPPSEALDQLLAYADDVVQRGM